MAKLKKGILGHVSGKIGPVIGSTWKSVNYVKAKPKKKNKKLPRTPAQLLNQKRFTFIQQWLVPFYPYITVGFANLAEDKTEINAAFSTNYKRVFSGAWPDITVDYSRFLISSGDLPGLNVPEIRRTDGFRLELSWKGNTERDVSFDDQLILVVYSPELKIASGFIGGVKRNALSCTYDLDPAMAGQTVEVYLSITSSDRKAIANSIYMGRLAP